MPTPWTREELHDAACQNVIWAIGFLNLANQIKEATKPGTSGGPPYYIVDNVTDTVLTGAAPQVLPQYDEAKSNGSITVT